MRVHLQTLGCRLNEAELETWSRQFRQLGHELTADPLAADLVVVNTCAVTGEAARKSRNLVRRAQAANPGARIVMSGCYASLEPERTAADLGVDLVVDNASKAELVDIVHASLNVTSMPASAIDLEADGPLERGRHRAFVKVQDGCRYRCTYCVVTLARGEEQSRPIPDILDEVRALHARGVQEIVLAGVHLGGYGAGTAGDDLHGLVSALLADTDIPRIRLGSLEPWDLPDGFWGLFGNPRLMPHLHLPIQSGADSVLRRMARRCRSDEFRALANTGRELVPDLNITTDIIVGFPGESDTEWAQTLAFARDLAFGHIHIFSYSPRSGTKAAGLPGQLPRAVKRERSAQLHEIALASRRQFLQAQEGRQREVLVENGERLENGQVRWAGYTPNYLRTEFLGGAGEDLDNRIVQVRLTAAGDDADNLTGSR